MRFVIALSAMFAVVSAWALPVYNCDVTAIAKTGSWREPWTKKLLVSAAFSNQVDFHETKLDLRVNAGGVLQGSVNGQPGFMLLGDVHQGRFESAYHKGEIKCGAEIDLPFVLQFIPWKQFFTVDPMISQGHIHTTFSLQQVDYGLLCFLGDVHEVHATMSQGFGVEGQIINPHRVDFTWDAEDCVEWRGSNPDDFECLRYQRNRRTKSVKDCYGEPDPRS